MKKELFIFLILSLVSGYAYSQEMKDSIVKASPVGVCLPDSIVRILEDNATLIDSLSSENSVLKSLLKEAQNENLHKEDEIAKLHRSIDDLQGITIKRLEASNDTLQRRLINMASNFLYIPYEEFSINEIAIPAFVSTKGKSVYTRYQNRLILLENYKDDISSLVSFLIQAEKDLGIDLTMFRKNKAKEHRNKLAELPLYRRYTSYDDWKNTYLGKQIYSIQNILKYPTKETPTKLKSIRTKLEGLLNTN